MRFSIYPAGSLLLVCLALLAYSFPFEARGSMESPWLGVALQAGCEHDDCVCNAQQWSSDGYTSATCQPPSGPQRPCFIINATHAQADVEDGCCTDFKLHCTARRCKFPDFTVSVDYADCPSCCGSEDGSVTVSWPHRSDTKLKPGEVQWETISPTWSAPNGAQGESNCGAPPWSGKVTVACEGSTVAEKNLDAKCNDCPAGGGS